MPDRVKPSFVIFDIWALWRSGLIVRMPGCQNITNDGLSWSGMGCFIAVPIWQQWASRVKGPFNYVGFITSEVNSGWPPVSTERVWGLYELSWYERSQPECTAYGLHRQRHGSAPRPDNITSHKEQFPLLNSDSPSLLSITDSNPR